MHGGIPTGAVSHAGQSYRPEASGSCGFRPMPAVPAAARQGTGGYENPRRHQDRAVDKHPDNAELLMLAVALVVRPARQRSWLNGPARTAARVAACRNMSTARLRCTLSLISASLILIPGNSAQRFHYPAGSAQRAAGTAQPVPGAPGHGDQARRARAEYGAPTHPPLIVSFISAVALRPGLLATTRTV